MPHEWQVSNTYINITYPSCVIPQRVLLPIINSKKVKKTWFSFIYTFPPDNKIVDISKTTTTTNIRRYKITRRTEKANLKNAT
jgi:hypothetical protein